jgi:hypothetical protein
VQHARRPKLREPQSRRRLLGEGLAPLEDRLLGGLLGGYLEAAGKSTDKATRGLGLSASFDLGPVVYARGCRLSMVNWQIEDVGRLQPRLGTEWDLELEQK